LVLPGGRDQEKCPPKLESQIKAEFKALGKIKGRNKFDDNNRTGYAKRRESKETESFKEKERK